MKRLCAIFLRYLILIATAFPNLYLFYKVLTPLTLYPVYFLINLFFDASLIGEKILFEGLNIELIKACIAGSAYYLLLILNLSTPDIKIAKRFKLIFFSFAFFLFFNILRIFFLSVLLKLNPAIFDSVHKLLWYFISTIFVVGIWFFSIRIFKIKRIPFYSDIKYFLAQRNKK